MARTQAAEYEQRREAIIDEAAILFAKRGFLGSSVSDLADACNTSKSLIYHYYASKEDILFEVMDGHLGALDALIDGVVAQNLSPQDCLRSMARGMMELYVDAAPRHKVLLNELDNLPPGRRAEIVARQRRLIKVVDKVLIKLSPKLGKSKANLRATTMLFFGMLNWTHTWFSPDRPLSAVQVADMAVDLMLRGLPA